jgi:hypothetical protein
MFEHRKGGVEGHLCTLTDVELKKLLFSTSIFTTIKLRIIKET